MLKRAFALSDQGAKDLAKGIIATACANLIQIIPASLLLMVVMMLLEKAAGTQVTQPWMAASLIYSAAQ